MQESNQIKTDRNSTQQTERKPYGKPELTRHGVVEDLTQVPTVLTPSQILELSDRNMKENFASVDVRNVLEKLAQVRVSTWNYKTDSKDVRHIGPMAQDFAKAFGVGDSDRVIHNVDSGGVAMASIQALYQMVLEQNQRIASLESEVRELREAAVAV
jgi:Chaperone of endosialidase